jgi:hypothetical protein
MKKHQIELGIEILMSANSLDANDKLLWEKFAAILELIPRMKYYSNKMFSEERLVRPISIKKIEFIRAATTQKQLAEILAPPKVRYNGNKVVPVGDYVIPEEELIIWSLTSLQAPLMNEGFQRYMEVFLHVFPEHKDILGL